MFELERLARFARLLFAAAAGLALVAFFLPWATFGASFVDLPTGPAVTGTDLHEWGLLARVVLLAGAAAFGLLRGFDRRLAFAALLIGLLTGLDLVAVAARLHGDPAALPGEVSLSLGFWMEVVAAVGVAIAGLGGLVAPEAPRVALGIVDRLLPPWERAERVAES